MTIKTSEDKKEHAMKTVLIVEDDPVNVRVFSKILTKRGGLNTKHTEDVEEVMEIALSGEADIILMDVSLARSVYKGKAVDGIKITQMLKSDPKTKDLPVILVTANAMPGDRENFLEQSGADGYISKPVIDHEDFINQIKSLLPSE
jgi:two-component system cell cycle response regulator DivK